MTPSNGHYEDLQLLVTVKAYPDADVYVRGRVRHPDHATVVLCGWHQVFLNTEERSGPGGRVMFLD